MKDNLPFKGLPCLGDMRAETGYPDRRGEMIHEGDFVCLGDDPNENNSMGTVMTADDSMGHLPNGWFFDITDIYKVVWDQERQGFTLDIPDTLPDSEYNCKYLNHARSRFVSCSSLIVEGDYNV